MKRASLRVTNWVPSSNLASKTARQQVTRPATAQVQVLENRTLLTALPAWLTAGSHATWNGATHALTLTGTATILSDPGADEPMVSASGTAERLTIQPGAAAIIHLGGLALSNGAVADVKSIGGNWAFHGNILLAIGAANGDAAPVFSIDSTHGSKLDLEDNNLVVHHGDYASIEALAQKGRNAGDWTGAGLSSSTAAAVDDDAGEERRAVGVVYNDDLPDTAAAWVEGGSSESLADDDVLIVYTYVGDFQINGLVDRADAAIFSNDYDNGRSTGFNWATGDTNGDGILNRADASFFSNNYGNGATPDAPVGPFGLAESITGPTAVSLTWSPAFGAVTNYHVFRSTDGVHFTELTTGAGNGTSFTDATAAAGTTYMYQLSADNQGNFSPVTTLPAMRFGDVSGLNATAASSSQINLAWTDNAVDSAAHIEIDRSTDGVNFTPLAATGLRRRKREQRDHGGQPHTAGENLEQHLAAERVDLRRRHGEERHAEHAERDIDETEQAMRVLRSPDGPVGDRERHARRNARKGVKQPEDAARLRLDRDIGEIAERAGRNGEAGRHRQPIVDLLEQPGGDDAGQHHAGQEQRHRHAGLHRRQPIPLHQRADPDRQRHHVEHAGHVAQAQYRLSEKSLAARHLRPPGDAVFLARSALFSTEA